MSCSNVTSLQEAFVMPYLNPFLTYPVMSTHYVKALASIRNDLEMISLTGFLICGLSSHWNVRTTEIWGPFLYIQLL